MPCWEVGGCGGRPFPGAHAWRGAGTGWGGVGDQSRVLWRDSVVQATVCGAASGRILCWGNRGLEAGTWWPRPSPPSMSRFWWPRAPRWHLEVPEGSGATFEPEEGHDCPCLSEEGPRWLRDGSAGVPTASSAGRVRVGGSEPGEGCRGVARGRAASCVRTVRRCHLGCLRVSGREPPPCSEVAHEELSVTGVSPSSAAVADAQLGRSSATRLVPRAGAGIGARAGGLLPPEASRLGV